MTLGLSEFRLCRRFRDASPEEIEALSLEAMETAVMAQVLCRLISIAACIPICRQRGTTAR